MVSPGVAAFTASVTVTYVPGTSRTAAVAMPQRSISTNAAPMNDVLVVLTETDLRCEERGQAHPNTVRAEPRNRVAIDRPPLTREQYGVVYPGGGISVK